MEPLKDPYKDRKIQQYSAPPQKKLDSKLFWSSDEKPNWKCIGKHLYAEGTVLKKDFVLLLDKVTNYLKREPNVLIVQDPLTIVGDIHGQFYDLIKVLETGGDIERAKYLFLGDYVDRGQFSIECLLFLFSIKVNYPKTVFLTRGNHECRQLTSYFNFKQECLSKFDQEVYDLIMDTFDQLPLGALINGKFLALHGGLSPELKTIQDMNQIKRNIEPPHKGILLDILWSDPTENETGAQEEMYKVNQLRGCSYLFGEEAFRNLQLKTGILSVIRAHQAQLKGYKMHYWNNSMFPSVITIFSAPNYCDKYNNKGALLIILNNSINIRQYEFTQHPFVHPNFIDVFTWSIPFVSSKITEMLCHILKNINDGSDSDSNESEEDEEFIKIMETINKNRQKQSEIKRKRVNIRQKIKFIGKMMLIKKALKENDEDVIRMKLLCPDNKMPADFLKNSDIKISTVIEDFNRIKSDDLQNEMLPNSKRNQWTSATQGLSFNSDQ